jgi:hypothetical protein
MKNKSPDAFLTPNEVADECQCLQRYLLNYEPVRQRRTLLPFLLDTQYSDALHGELKSIYRKSLR